MLIDARTRFVRSLLSLTLAVLMAGLVACSSEPPRDAAAGPAPEAPKPAGQAPATQAAPSPAAPAPAARPAPPAAPAPVLTSVPAGTALAVRIDESLSTEKSAEGDTFSGSLAKDLVIDGKTLAPAGSTVSGVVYHSVRSGKVKGLAELGLRLTSLTVAGEKHSITSQNWFQQAKATKKD